MIEKIIAIPALNDNYMWTLIDKIKQSAIVIDPGDADPIIATLEELGINLAMILLTHHHQDHSGGIKKLIDRWNAVSIIGSKHSPCNLLTHRVQEGEEINCGSLMLDVLEIPGHTLDHLAYYNNAILFSGDTLFSAGCGRVFEGTHEQMYQSLQKLSQLPDDTKLYCGHEYTFSNLQFAKKVEPDNLAIDESIQSVTAMRKNNLPTLPSTLLQEKKINPFLRCDVPDVILAAENHAGRRLTTPVDVFTSLREWKNKS